jgi:hypothetical protein
MGFCLAAFISHFPSAAKYTTSKANTIFLVKIAKGEEDAGAEEMMLLIRLEGDEEGLCA